MIRLIVILALLLSLTGCANEPSAKVLSPYPLPALADQSYALLPLDPSAQPEAIAPLRKAFDKMGMHETLESEADIIIGHWLFVPRTSPRPSAAPEIAIDPQSNSAGPIIRPHKDTRRVIASRRAILSITMVDAMAWRQGHEDIIYQAQASIRLADLTSREEAAISLVKALFNNLRNDEGDKTYITK